MKTKFITLVLIIFTYNNVNAVVDTTFTYQGELTDGGSPAQGTYDIVIQAYNNAAGTGNALAESEHTAIEVNAGLFTIEAVNLGSTIFDGLDSWLLIMVKKPADPSYTILTPLQKMRSVPYANSLIDKGATGGQVLTFDNISGWQPSTPVIGTDDQNISGSGLNGTNLTIGIEGGTNQTVDLGPIQDGTGTDDQNISGSGLNGTNLTIGIEGGSNEVVDLSPLQGSSGGTNLIRVSDSAVLGKVIGVSFGTKEWTIINNNGFIVHVNADGVPKIESALYNDGSCTTDPLYLQFATNSNATGSIVASQGLVFTIQDIGTYYVAQNTTLIDNAAYNRRRNSPTNCQSQTIPVNTVIPLLINSEAVTGVPDGGYGPVTIQ